MQLDMLEISAIAEPEIRMPRKVYAFEGDVVRITEQDFARLKKNYKNIEDLMATLSTIDAYYACNSDRAERWYMGMMAWLLRDNQKAAKLAKAAAYGTDWW